MAEPEDDGFLSRWSARKRQGTSVANASEDESALAPDEPRDAEPEAEKTDAEILEALELPDPDTLVKGDDFSKFMTSAVPARLRNRALRRLWLTDPVLANLDEMIDYGEDFTDAATVVENMKTVYDSVRGMLPEETEDDEDPEVAEDDTVAEPEDDTPEDVEMAEPEAGAEDVATLAADQAQTQPLPVMQEDLAPRPQRMRFRFDKE